MHFEELVSIAGYAIEASGVLVVMLGSILASITFVRSYRALPDGVAYTTPEGRHVSICPASVRDDVSCATCGVCAIVSRRTIIGFPAHGTGTAKAAKVFFMARASSGPPAQ